MGDVKSRKKRKGSPTRTRKKRRRSRSKVRIGKGGLVGSKKNIEMGLPLVSIIHLGDDDTAAKEAYCELRQVLKWTTSAIAEGINQLLGPQEFEIDASELRSIMGRCPRRRKKSRSRKKRATKQTSIETPTGKKTLSQKQLAALAKGRATRAANLAARS